MQPFNLFKTSLSLLFLFILFGCEEKFIYSSVDQNFTFEKQESIKQLQKRYLQYWDYTSKGEYQKAYTMELPYLKYIKSEEWYLNFKNGNKKGFYTTMLSLDFDKDDRDIVYVISFYQHKDRSHKFRDKWIFINNEWYHHFTPSILPQL